MAILMGITTALTFISALFLAALIHIYTKNLKKIKSKFTIGLFVFAALFLLQNTVSLYFYFTMMDYYAPQVGLHVFIFTLLQTIAFFVLLKLTWE
ncbi:hypothetical protein HYY70_01520 [Candidatus Woesearchaeota archaeon]|nr:hypothetical protein [Candidatus Woesearchaeota archaeon]